MDEPLAADGAPAAVLAANDRFYEAFEAGDLDAMSAIWEHSPEVSCTHPGWPTLRGWAQVSSSWFAIFRNPQRLQVILTSASVSVVGDAAWVAVDENLLDGGPGQTVSALNVFRRRDGVWRVVAHHGSPVLRR